MPPESQFQGLKPTKKRRSRKLRKNYDVIVLPACKAKGRFRKGEGFRRIPVPQRAVVIGGDFWMRQDD